MFSKALCVICGAVNSTCNWGTCQKLWFFMKRISSRLQWHNIFYVDPSYLCLGYFTFTPSVGGMVCQIVQICFSEIRNQVRVRVGVGVSKTAEIGWKRDRWMWLETVREWRVADTAAHWLRLITWPGHWPLIGCERVKRGWYCCWLVKSDHVTRILASDWLWESDAWLILLLITQHTMLPDFKLIFKIQSFCLSPFDSCTQPLWWASDDPSHISVYKPDFCYFKNWIHAVKIHKTPMSQVTTVKEEV